jgi:hypothetical protein
MTRTTRKRRHRSNPFDWPALTDQTAIELLGGLQKILAQFESHYFAQLRRTYEDRFERNLRQHHLSEVSDGEPF